MRPESGSSKKVPTMETFIVPHCRSGRSGTPGSPRLLVEVQEGLHGVGGQRREGRLEDAGEDEVVCLVARVVDGVLVLGAEQFGGRTRADEDEGVLGDPAAAERVVVVGDDRALVVAEVQKVAEKALAVGLQFAGEARNVAAVRAEEDTFLIMMPP